MSPESLSPESDLRTWLRDQPRSWLRLPWTTPREARATLSRDAAARLAPFEACLRDSWRADQKLPISLRRVAALLAEGRSDKDIAEVLAMPLATARTYVARSMKRLGCQSRRELMLGAGHGRS